MNANSQCIHTKDHIDGNGDLLGSWAEELVTDPALGARIRVACGVCGKFYGYRRDATHGAKYLRDGLIGTTSRSSVMGPSARIKTPDREDATIAGSNTTPIVKSRCGNIDYEELRRRVSIADVLRQLHWQPADVRGAQLRGPCPVHGSTRERSRIMSVNLDRNIFQCFKCGAKGNQLDLWSQVRGLPIYEAALDLCQNMAIDPPSKRGELA